MPIIKKSNPALPHTYFFSWDISKNDQFALLSYLAPLAGEIGQLS